MNRDDVLQYLHGFTDHRIFSPVHSLVRFLYRGPVRQFVKAKMGLEVLIRHSVLSGVGFNLFSSDLDCTLVVPRPFSLQDADKIRARYEHVKSSLPMLGEPEMFSDSELQMLRALSLEQGPLLSLLRDLKKIRWMEWKLDASRHPYHFNKAERAIYRIIRKYEPAFVGLDRLVLKGNHRFLGEGFTRHFKSLVAVDAAVEAIRSDLPDSFSMHSREIDASIGSVGTHQPALSLAVPTALCLLSLFPSHEDDDAQVLALLNRLRQTPEIRALHVCVLKHDLLYANASPRIHTQYRSTSWQWTECLIRQLKAYLSDAEFVKIKEALNYHPSNGNGFV